MAFSTQTCAVAQPDQNRQDLLDWLYVLDGRDNPEHEYHASYTALYLNYIETIGRWTLKGLENEWHLSNPPHPKDGSVVRSEIVLRTVDE